MNNVTITVPFSCILSILNWLFSQLFLPKCVLLHFSCTRKLSKSRELILGICISSLLLEFLNMRTKDMSVLIKHVVIKPNSRINWSEAKQVCSNHLFEKHRTWKKKCLSSKAYHHICETWLCAIPQACTANSVSLDFSDVIAY